MNLEERVIQRAAAFPKFHNALILGIEDDAAVLQPSQAKKLIWAVDTLVENTHFLRSMPAEDIGWKALAVNLSDLAAMNALPIAALLSLGLPSDLPYAWIESFFNGLEACCKEYQVDLAGGDTVRQSSEINISISVLGESSRPLLRKNAAAGDLLVVTGRFGSAAAGLHCFKQGLSYPELLKAHLRPMPRFLESKRLAQISSRIALMDTSDGLVRSLQLLCEANNLGCVINQSAIPIAEDLTQNFSKPEYWPWVLNGGEDYELLAAVPSDRSEVFEKEPGFTVIGQLCSEPHMTLISEGKMLSLNDQIWGYQHF